jgi:hypothetical protein
LKTFFRSFDDGANKKRSIAVTISHAQLAFGGIMIATRATGEFSRTLWWLRDLFPDSGRLPAPQLYASDRVLKMLDAIDPLECYSLLGSHKFYTLIVTAICNRAMSNYHLMCVISYVNIHQSQS